MQDNTLLIHKGKLINQHFGFDDYCPDQITSKDISLGTVVTHDKHLSLYVVFQIISKVIHRLM